MDHIQTALTSSVNVSLILPVCSGTPIPGLLDDALASAEAPAAGRAAVGNAS